MNRNTFVLFLLVCVMLISACGQYGDLYAPSEEVVQEEAVAEEVAHEEIAQKEATQEQVEDKDKQ